MKLFRSIKFQIAMVLVVAAAWKLLFILWDVIPFNADEAVVGLMARHILMGERPVFFYGQAYMGSLDAFLVAGSFFLFGQHVWCIRLVQSLLYLATIASTIWIGKEAFRSMPAGILAALLLAFPTVNVMLYTTASLGGYGEALALGNLCLLLALFVSRRLDSAQKAGAFPTWMVGLWGFTAGLGLWANGLTLIYSVPAGVYLLWLFVKKRPSSVMPFLLFGGIGFFLGSLPWWIFAFSNGPARLLQELFGSAVAVEKVSWFVRTGNHIINFLLLGLTVIFGFRPPWSVTWLIIPGIPMVLVFWIAVIGFIFRQLRKGSGRGRVALIAGVAAMLLAGFLFTPFGVDPSGRYFLPLAVLLALFAAQMILTVCHRPWQIALLTGLVIGYQLGGTLQCALHDPPGLTTQFYEPTIIDHRADQELMNFLRQQGETRGYSNYWVSYPLAFHSNEEIIFAPRLPYHLDLRYTPRDDRYPTYQKMVQQSPRTAFITTRNPALDLYLRDQLAQLGVSWKEQKIGDYLVYYHLSRAVSPAEIGLGELRE